MWSQCMPCSLVLIEACAALLSAHAKYGTIKKGTKVLFTAHIPKYLDITYMAQIDGPSYIHVFTCALL